MGGTKRTAGDSADRDGEEGEGEVRDEVLASSGLVGASGRVEDGRGKSGDVEDGKAVGEEDARKGHRRGSLTGERRWEGASSSPSCFTSFAHDARRGSVSAAAAAALGGGAPSKAGCSALSTLAP